MRRVLTARRLAVAAALPLLVSGVAACGGSDEPSMGEAASESPAGEESPSEDGAEEGPEEGQEIEPASFAEDVAEGLDSVSTARMTMEVTGQGDMTMEGDVDYTTKPPSFAATMSSATTGTPEGMEVIMVDGMLYLTHPAAKGKFIEIDLDDPSGPMAGMGELSEQMDLRQSMKTFTEAVTKVTYVGEEEVDGEELERYEITMDPSKAKSMQNVPAGTEPVTYDAWFDDDKVMRQMAVDMPGGSGTMSMKLSDLGKDVEIEAPPANKIAEMPGM